MRRSEALAVVGGLGKPSKMPGKSYGLPAGEYCHTGGRLLAVSGSTCSDCYACKGNYAFSTVKRAQERRLKAALIDRRWVCAMVAAIGTEQWFRWHDSGDLQSVTHLARICQVARLTPGTRHWLPTREYAIVKQFLAIGGKIPSNLVVRLSAHMVDGKPPDMGLPTSTVHSAPDSPVTRLGSVCPAPQQGGVCGDCRACWDASVRNCSYAKH